MKQVKIGVLGARRGQDMIRFCMNTETAVLTAICDNSPKLQEMEAKYPDRGIRFFADFDSFLQEADMDAVVLANYANDHASFAIRCLNAGKHVMSEVLPVETMAEAVALIEAVEKSGKVYAYGENYCYMPAPREMKKLLKEGRLGKFEYGEGEYMHNCEPDWASLTLADPMHWRNRMYSTYYCTHSIGPLLFVTGERPVRVSGFEVPFNDRMYRMGAQAGPIGMEIITLESGALLKSIHGVGPSENSIWYSIYGSEGRVESAREDAENGAVDRVYLNLTKNKVKNLTSYEPAYQGEEAGKTSNHNGADHLVMEHFVKKILGDPEAEIIDVYRAMDMFLPGLFAYRSILHGNMPYEIPDLRDPAVRERYRNDTSCTNPEKAGENLLPVSPGGDPQIPDSVYAAHRQKLIDNKVL